MKALLIRLSITSLLTLMVSAVRADPPRAVGWEIVEHDPAGTAVVGPQDVGDARFAVRMYPADSGVQNSNLLVVFPECENDPAISARPIRNFNGFIKGRRAQPLAWENPGPRWRICPDTDVVVIPAGDFAGLTVGMRSDFLRFTDEGLSPRLQAKVYVINDADLGPNVTPAILARQYAAFQPAATFTIDVYYHMNVAGEWQWGDYASVFGTPAPDPAIGAATLDYQALANELPVDLKAYRRKLAIPGVVTGDDRPLSLDAVVNAGSSAASESGSAGAIEPNASASTKRRIARAPKDAGPFSHTLSGIFSTKWTRDHALHPGFGFRVEAWTTENGWHLLASDWVQYDGTWKLRVPRSAGYRGSELRIYYRSYNDYYAPQNQNGDRYSWMDPEQFNISPDFSAGNRYADTDGGTFNGTGELVDAAMVMWSRLYWEAQVNPVPTSALKLYYPNTWNNCDSPSPWSCASTSGEIWLIASHGTDATTVNHEMAHQLNYKFWGSKLPENSGGEHTLDGCYSNRLGMALTEGFADFMSAWVGYRNRNIAEGNFASGRWALGYDPESTRSPPNCSNGWENESWVARTFWDLHDMHSDGNDTLWFVHPGAVLSLYLANGVATNGDARDMRYYQDIYRNAASPGHQQLIEQIFKQNRM